MLWENLTRLGGVENFKSEEKFANRLCNQMLTADNYSGQ